MRWIYITAVPEIADYALRSGVHEVMVDLETIGKHERQGHLPTHKALHTLADVGRVRAAVGPDANVMTRVNPLGSHTQGEVDAAIELGASRLMLPMFNGGDDVAIFSAIVGSRVPVTWLVETPSALATLKSYLPRLGPQDWIHFGLNDLTIAMGLNFAFEPLAMGLLDDACQTCAAENVNFGIGGVGRVGEGKAPPELVLTQHARLGSTQAILSKAFRGTAGALSELLTDFDMALELKRLETAYADALKLDDAELAAETNKFKDRVLSGS